MPAVAEFIARGSAPLASRDEVSALVAEDPALSRGVGDVLADLWEQFCDEVDPEGVVPAGVHDDEGCDGACRSGCDWCDSWSPDTGDEEDDEERAAREASLGEALSRIRARLREPRPGSGSVGARPGPGRGAR